MESRIDEAGVTVEEALEHWEKLHRGLWDAICETNDYEWQLTLAQNEEQAAVRVSHSFSLASQADEYAESRKTIASRQLDTRAAEEYLIKARHKERMSAHSYEFARMNLMYRMGIENTAAISEIKTIGIKID